ncbi:MAG: homoserine kinase [Thaumarchaeota archaeon]|nr:homoserine kinase [Nitrososphaerota archaeon]
MTSKTKVVADAPASSANLGPGFDVFALALDAPRDMVAASFRPLARFSLKVEVEGDVRITSDPRRNSAGAVALSMAREYGLAGDLRLNVWKKVPTGVGLGGSGASSAAAAAAVDSLFGLRLGMGDLIRHAGAGEKAASGTPHLDNVTASLFGGFVIVPGGERSKPLKFDPPAGLSLAIATPEVALPARKTAYARSLLPKSVGLNGITHNILNASLMVAGFASGNIGWIGEGMHDAIVEVARKEMVPGYDRVREAALDSGASGVCISGAGPSVLAMVDGRRASAKRILASMVEGFGAEGVAASGFTTKPGRGAKVLEDS